MAGGVGAPKRQVGRAVGVETFITQATGEPKAVFVMAALGVVVRAFSVEGRVGEAEKMGGVPRGAGCEVDRCEAVSKSTVGLSNVHGDVVIIEAGGRGGCRARGPDGRLGDVGAGERSVIDAEEAVAIVLRAGRAGIGAAVLYLAVVAAADS